MLGGNTPDKIDVTLDEEYHEMEVEIKPTRDELIARYQVRRFVLFFVKALILPIRLN